jgi:hypothetical protein
MDWIASSGRSGGHGLWQVGKNRNPAAIRRNGRQKLMRLRRAARKWAAHRNQQRTFGLTPMPTDHSAPAVSANRNHSRNELTRFYRAIGIPAVASAVQAARMNPPKPKADPTIPAFLRETQPLG